MAEDLTPIYAMITVLLGVLAAVIIGNHFRKKTGKDLVDAFNAAEKGRMKGGKPDFKLIDIKPYWIRKQEPEKIRFVANLKNVGTKQARDIRVSFKYYGNDPSLRQLIQHEKEFSNHYLPIKGTILPDSFTSINWQKEWKLTEGKLWVAIWVTYKFNQDDKEECIFISHVIGECTDGEQPTFFSNDDIKEDRKSWNDLLSGKGGI